MPIKSGNFLWQFAQADKQAKVLQHHSVFHHFNINPESLLCCESVQPFLSHSSGGTCRSAHRRILQLAANGTSEIQWITRLEDSYMAVNWHNFAYKETAIISLEITKTRSITIYCHETLSTYWHTPPVGKINHPNNIHANKEWTHRYGCEFKSSIILRISHTRQSRTI
jgi:hypothetical protein